MKNLFVRLGQARGFADKGRSFHVVLVIGDGPPPGAPPSFKLHEAVVVRLRPAEAEAPASVSGDPSNRLPHDQVVRPQALIALFAIPLSMCAENDTGV